MGTPDKRVLYITFLGVGKPYCRYFTFSKAFYTYHSAGNSFPDKWRSCFYGMGNQQDRFSGEK